MQRVQVQSLLGELRSYKPPSQKKTEHKKQKQYCNNLNKDFKNGPLKKILKNHNEILSHTYLDGYY